MQTKKRKSPSLRFRGYTDDWEERKLSNESTITAGGDIDKSKLKEVGEYPIFANALTNDGTVGYYDSYYRVEAPAVTVTGRGDVGHAKARKVNFTPVVRLLAVKSNHDVDFLENAINNHKVLVESTGVPQLTAPQLGNYKIFFPTGEEQQKIGSFFKQLDKTIALHQRKLDLLKEQKKGFLQKMFPKNGAKVPELRFAGFADDWEERKLSDIANHRGGTAIEKYFDKDGVYKVISIGSYGLNSQYVDQNIRAISNEITDGRVVNSGELTMVLNDKTANGTIIGRSLLVEKDNEYVINQRTEIISPKEKFDSNFAYTILNGPFREKVKRIVQGGTQIYVNYPAVSNLNLELPKIEEQRKISSFFKQLDDTIALHQRKLDLLKEQKKGYLQKMFV
ncbi:restriction endonuclease subunit S [Leuconostoc mesenteroides]|uniref:restriction endonuclease subunit S n=1 Tax=Leuconostoc mesenteroides TaxID=1245 RepID=UPI001364258D|nr:restriction endonuclease subunit S [Leuconostoc mesenteroides]QHM58088.1 hypothetical protein C7M45_00793 [Leuconostoc mesenteroides]